MSMRAISPAALAACLLVSFGIPVIAGAPNAYQITRLVSNQAGVAQNTDPDLVNSWGIAHSPTGPLWVSDNGTDKSTLYDRTTGAKQDLTVAIPHGAPTGMVFVRDHDGTTDDFPITANDTTASSVFLFATESGFIEGWSPSVDLNNAVVAVDRSGEGAVFKGLALAHIRERLYAADFVNNRVLIFDDQFNQIGSFTDTELPNRFAPFNVATINDVLYVAFAKRERDGIDNVNGRGLGYVDVFSDSGKLKQRLIANGPLNAPWGMTLAPANFGAFSGALLVGNFGDGKINAFTPDTGDFLGTLSHPSGRPLSIDGLWALDGNRDGTVTFSAGPDDEANGLVGKILVAGTAIAKK
ncbi:MAG TPA: TIGR03118 family protein [Rhizomicrobium sp.]